MLTEKGQTEKWGGSQISESEVERLHTIRRTSPFSLSSPLPLGGCYFGRDANLGNLRLAACPVTVGCDQLAGAPLATTADQFRRARHTTIRRVLVFPVVRTAFGVPASPSSLVATATYARGELVTPYKEDALESRTVI